MKAPRSRTGLDKCPACSQILHVSCPHCGQAVTLSEGKISPHEQTICTGSHIEYKNCPRSGKNLKQPA